MIKFFRHIRKSLLEKNKMGKYFKYAIGEIILVMIGILLALQVSNWNENRKTKNQELVLLRNLKLEMKNNVNLLNDYLRRKQTSIKNVTKLLSYTNPNYSEKKEDSIEYKLSRIFTIDNFIPEIMVLEAAQNSNSIKLIKNQNIKVGLSKWEQSLKKVIEFDDFSSSHFNNSFIPMVSSFYPFVNIKYNSKSQVNENLSMHKPELEKLFRNRDFENIIFRMKNFYKLRILKAEDLKKHTQDLVNFIEKQLNTKN